MTNSTRSLVQSNDKVVSIYELQYQKNSTTTYYNLALDESDIAIPEKQRVTAKEYSKAYIKLLTNYIDK